MIRLSFARSVRLPRLLLCCSTLDERSPEPALKLLVNLDREVSSV